MHPTATLSTSLPEGRAPEWVQLTPLGTFTGRDGRGPWRIADVNAARKVVAATNAYGGPTELVIDYDHQTDKAVPNGGTAPAAGWIKEIQIRKDGIWGRVEWTAQATAAITSKVYRYLSPVFNYDDKTGDIVRLLRAGLTNTPNFNLTALASTGAAMNEFKMRLISLLGLSEGATEANIIQGIENLKTSTAANSTVPDPEQYVPRAMYDGVATALASLQKETGEGQAAAKVEAAMLAGKVSPAMKGWALALCAQNADAFDQFVATAPAIVPTTPLKLGAPPKPGDVGLNADQLAVCSTMGINPADYAKNI